MREKVERCGYIEGRYVRTPEGERWRRYKVPCRFPVVGAVSDEVYEYTFPSGDSGRVVGNVTTVMIPMCDYHLGLATEHLEYEEGLEYGEDPLV